MTMGFGVFLFVVGAILAFALNLQVDWVDLKLVGYILMGAGGLAFLVGLGMHFSRRSASSTTRTTVDPASGTRITESEQRLPNDQP